MNISIKLIITFLIFVTISSCSNANKSSIILKDVAIINIQDGQISVNSILIENSIIKEIGLYSELNKNNLTKVINCKGKYVIPGLFDMHTHLFEEEDSSRFLDTLLSNGIIGLRDMGGVADSLATLKSNIKLKIIDGPDIYFAGPTLDGEGSTDPGHLIVNDSTDIKSLVTRLNELKVDHIKVYNYFPINRLEELINEAQKYEIKVAGHIPWGIDGVDAAILGMSSIEHMSSLVSGLVLKKSNQINTITEAFVAMDSSYINSLSKSFIEHQTAFTPTLYTMQEGYNSSDDENSRRLGMLMMDRFLPILLAMKKNGVLILAGSDVVPINENNTDALHKELKWLVKAGFSNLEALQTATLNPTKFLKIDNEYGSIEVNKKASLIILNSNPIDDISNSKDINFVLKNGKLY